MSKNFEQDYINSIDSSAPDMDKLWERIAQAAEADAGTDKDITPFLSAAEECARASAKRRSVTVRSFTAAAAVFGAVICAVMTFSDSGINGIAKNDALSIAPAADEGISKTAGVQNSFDSVYENDYAAEASGPMAAVAAAAGWDFAESCNIYEGISYESLNLAETAGGTYTALSNNKEDEEYFVEQRVLSETEMFLDGRVTDIETSGDEIIYTLELIHAVAEEGMTFPETVRVSSRSPYALRENREYLLPVKEENGGYRIVFDNAPQIEFTLDREVVCHNGWKTLSAGDTPINYPRAYEDDFFYDRMNITAEISLGDLFEEWERLRE